MASGDFVLDRSKMLKDALPRALGTNFGVSFVTQEEDGSFKVLTSPMMSRDDAAKYLGVGVNQFYELRLRKRGRGHRPYHKTDLDGYLEKRKKFL